MRGRRWKPGTLAAVYEANPDGIGPDVVVHSPTKPDGGLLAHALTGVSVHDGRSLIGELHRRGYDLATLRFTVRRRSPKRHPGAPPRARAPGSVCCGAGVDDTHDRRGEK